MTSAALSIGELIGKADASIEAKTLLFASLYRELHAIAERELHRGRGDLTLGTTTLLHEAYLTIAAREGAQFASRPQFLAYAARAMRGLIIDYARARRAQKRGGAFEFTSTASEVAEGAPAPESSFEALGTALDELAEVEPDLAQLVDLHFFCGLSFGEVAGVRGVSERTVQRDWRRARLLLHQNLQQL